MENLQSDNMPKVTISIGIAFYPEDNEDIQEIFKIADNRLYQAKNLGRNQVC